MTYRPRRPQSPHTLQYVSTKSSVSLRASSVTRPVIGITPAGGPVASSRFSGATISVRQYDAPDGSRLDLRRSRWALSSASYALKADVLSAQTGPFTPVAPILEGRVSLGLCPNKHDLRGHITFTQRQKRGRDWEFCRLIAPLAHLPGRPPYAFSYISPAHRSAA